jgi:hypothetical protein
VLAREAECAGYAAEEAAYGALVNFKSWLTAFAGSTANPLENTHLDVMEDAA